MGTMTGKRFRRALAAGALLVAWAGGPGAIWSTESGSPAVHAWQPQPPPATDEFVPVSELPPEEQVPALPLLTAAYAVAWIMIIGYVFTLWRRLGTVQRELGDVTRRLSDRERSS